MKRIALVCNEYPPGPHGGVGTFTCDLAEGLAQRGVAVVVFVIQESGGHWKSGRLLNGVEVRVIELSSPSFLRWRGGVFYRRIKILLTIWHAHLRERFELVEAIDNHGFMSFGGIPGVPFVVRLHGASFLFDRLLGSSTSDSLTHLLEEWSLCRADFTVAVSEYIGRRELELGNVSRACDRVIYNAVDTNVFSPGEETIEGLIVFANSIHPRKGVEELCEAMNYVLPNFPDAKLVLIGKHIVSTASGREFWKQALDRVRPEFRSAVTFTGRLEFRSEVLGYLRKAEVCCYPSQLEGFGIAPVEAMSVGKPTIYSRQGPGSEVVEDGVTGLLCDPSDPRDIAAKICVLLGDRKTAAEMGKRARQEVIRRFSKAKWIDQNLEAYECFIEELARRRRTVRPSLLEKLGRRIKEAVSWRLRDLLEKRRRRRLRSTAERMQIHWSKLPSDVTMIAPGGGIGDELLCTPIFDELKRLRPEMRINFLSRYKGYFESHRSIHSVSAIRPPAEQAIQLAYADAVPPVKPLMTLMAECVGFDCFRGRISPPQHPISEKVEQLLNGLPRPLISVQPLSSAWTPNKNWPARYWVELLELLLRNYSVIEVGTKSIFDQSFRHPRFRSVAGETEVSEFAAIIQASAAFIGPSSGGMHLANGFGVPSLILFGGYETPIGYEYERTVAFFRSELDCAPCWKCEECPFDRECLKRIKPEAVVSALKNLLETAAQE